MSGTTEKWLRTHVGQGCASCDMTYEQCTERIFRGHGACCGLCYATDTHEEETLSDREIRMRKIADKTFKDFEVNGAPLSSWTSTMKARLIQRVLWAAENLGD